MKNIKKSEYLARVGILSAVATIMYLFLPEIPVGISHLKIDISDIPTLLAAFTTGPSAGVATLVFKNIIHLFKGDSFGVGELMNVIIGCVMIFSMLFGMKLFKKLYKSEKTLDYKVYFSACVLTAVATVLMGFIANLFIAAPIYFTLMNIPFTWEVALTQAFASIPLNTIKSILISVAVFPIMRPLKKYMKKDNSILAEI